MLPEAAGRGQHFQARGHSFSLYGPTLSRQITCLFFSCGKLVLQPITNGFVYATLSLNELARRLLTICKKKSSQSERVTQILDKERCIKEQVFFESTQCHLLSSPMLFSGVKFRTKFETLLQNNFGRIRSVVAIKIT